MREVLCGMSVPAVFSVTILTGGGRMRSRPGIDQRTPDGYAPIADGVIFRSLEVDLDGLAGCSRCRLRLVDIYDIVGGRNLVRLRTLAVNGQSRPVTPGRGRRNILRIGDKYGSFYIHVLLHSETSTGDFKSNGDDTPSLWAAHHHRSLKNPCQLELSIVSV